MSCSNCSSRCNALVIIVVPSALSFAFLFALVLASSKQMSCQFEMIIVPSSFALLS